MSFSSSLSINDSAAAAKSFVLISQNGQDSERIDSASTATQPRKLAIRHTVQGKGVAAVDRHLVQFSDTKLDAAGNPVTAVVNLTIAVPRSSTITATNIKDLWYFVKNFVTDANLDSLKLGES